ncbi:MAG: transglycosylase SLT domain-containing protein [Treponema sp.]|nr:transglycosylase SLT domain-containing protein [Treponema sp.]
MKKFLLAAIFLVTFTNVFAATKKAESSNDSDSVKNEEALTTEIAEDEAILESIELEDKSVDTDAEQENKSKKKTSAKKNSSKTSTKASVQSSNQISKKELKDIEDLNAQLVDDEDQNPVFMEETVRRLPPDLDGYDHPLVEKYRKQFLRTGGRKYLAAMVEAGNLYWQYIREKIEEYNMPHCLLYLPIVESSFKPTAKSRSGALGMWQFMENSMKPFLKKTEFVDERLDPWKSTEAAFLKLQDNYKQFGDWEIAIAAYNCGAGAMAKVTKNNPDKDFWYLAENKLLKSETLDYVPKLLAICDLMQNAEYYGLELPEEEDIEEDAFTYIKMTGAVPLSQLALAAGLETSDISSLNTALYRGITIPGYELRIPTELETTITEALEKIKDHEFSNAHVVVKGETLWGISRTYGVSVDAICQANGISENSILSIGKTLFVPILK